MSGSGTPQVFDFIATGSIEAFVVPTTGTYEITSFGAQGGAGSYGISPTTTTTSGGLGGEAQADFALTQGQTLEIAVGETGQSAAAATHSIAGVDAGGGGGGGSFVVLVSGSVDTPIEVAGGGGGGSGSSSAVASSGGTGGAGDSGTGSGGAADTGGNLASGGAGFYSPGGQTYSSLQIITGGVDFAGGPGLAPPLSGGVDGVLRLDARGGGGGFGGGGAGAVGSGGGGGGGYTGGDAGAGGTSFVASTATNAVLTPGVQSGDGDVQIDLVSISCFAQGTRIATPAGPVSVEGLRSGDMVLSARRDVPVEVRWVGHRHIDCTRHADPAKVYPVRIRAGAFGPGLPVRNLFLSPDHAVFVDGVLIPVWVLANGTNVRQKNVRDVTYWHVELDQHDVLLAEGLPVESYLNIGSRAAFTGGTVTALVPDFACRVWEAKGCAPLRVTGPEVEAAQSRLAGRLGIMKRQKAA